MKYYADIILYKKEKKIHYSGIDFGLFYNNMHNIIQLAIRNNIANSGVYQYINVLNYNTLGYQTSFSYNFYPYLEVALGIGQTGKELCQWWKFPFRQ